MNSVYLRILLGIVTISSPPGAPGERILQRNSSLSSIAFNLFLYFICIIYTNRFNRKTILEY